ncbi:hypothetical protein DCC81_08130 [Chitinophaga parva]|uniref:VOC domain-containing protein n=1 Tax=Chitinophaga parva TaxID=2169414 RepID=A0A2T7BP07_9BACT|nr:VOC family protein [Chitinophaga parva]PUZ29404.1 hypothetical protein DCC81_08130 [Chitinophaga parva]
MAVYKNNLFHVVGIGYCKHHYHLLAINNLSMTMQACIPVIPSADLQRSLRFWVEGLGLAVDREIRQDGVLVGCMVFNEKVCFWLNQRAGGPIGREYEGIRLYWTPDALFATRDRLARMGYEVSAIEQRDYGQTEFFLTDDDGYSHCFGVATL